ncbi:MAG: MerR family transcriptional regulator [Micropruina sp.]
MEWTVQELAERAGISGRTLRHYHQIGLLLPDRIGTNGYRYYGARAVARLQRILLLRETGMPLPDIATALDAADDPGAEAAALESHLSQLQQERDGIERRMQAVEHTLEMRREGREPRMDLMLDGFNDRYEHEVVERWGREVFEVSNRWWHGKSISQQRAWKRNAENLLARWRELSEAGEAPDSEAAQEHAARHMDWFAEIPGTPTHAGDTEGSAAMVRGLAATYESNPDFHDSFGSVEAARFAAAALRLHVA